MKLTTKRLLSASALAFAMLGSPLFAADAVRPSVECLPDNTILLARMPNGQKLVDEMRAQTKFGRVMLSPERIDNAFKKFKEKDPAAYAKAEKDLAQYGLKIEDLKNLFTGDSGMAMSMTTPKKGEAPVAMAYFWLEPQGDLGPKIHTAIQKSAENGGEEKPKRVDLKIAGIDVTKLTSATYTMKTPPMEVPPNFEKMTDAERDAWLKDQAAKRQPQRVKTGETNAYFALLGNRVVGMMTVPETNAGGQAAAKSDPKAEEAKFGEYLQAHLASGKPTGFYAKVNKTPGLQGTMPEGTVAFDGYFDPSIIVKIAGAMPATDPARDPAQILQQMGLDNLGPIVFRSVLAGTQMKSNAFLSTPGARKGLLTLLDQPELAPEPAPWATSTLATYAHWSFDLGKAYKVVREMAVIAAGPEAEQNFQMAEAQCQGMLKTDIASILSSLGMQHSLGLYPVEAPAKGKDQKAKGEGADEAPDATPTQPMVGVWNLTNQAVWTQIMQVVTPFVAQPNGNILAVAEQGYTGFRTGPNSPVESAVLTGKNYLVAALGTKVAEQTLSALNAPPAGEASLKQGKAFARAKTIIKLRPSIFFAVATNEKGGEQMIESFLTGFERGIKNQDPSRGANLDSAIELFRSILPKPEELSGALGVSVSQAYNTPSGVILESVSDLPKE